MTTPAHDPYAYRDGILLAMRAEGLPYARIGRRFGMTRMGALLAVRRAQRRQSERERRDESE